MRSPVLMWIDAVWVLVLGFLALVVRREYGLVKALAHAGGGAVSDGPAIGSLAPREARGSDRLVLFLFGDCAPCHEIASRLARLPLALRLDVAVTDGAMPGSSRSVLELLPARSTFTVLSADAAERCRLSLSVRSGPFAVMIRNDIVTAKGYLRGEADIYRLSGSRPDLELVHASENHES